MKAFFKRLYGVWMKFAHLIGRINTTILLTLFYIVFIGTAKIVSILLSKDPLNQAWGGTSYWKKRDNFRIDRGAFLKPY